MGIEDLQVLIHMHRRVRTGHNKFKKCNHPGRPHNGLAHSYSSQVEISLPPRVDKEQNPFYCIIIMHVQTVCPQ